MKLRFKLMITLLGMYIYQISASLLYLLSLTLNVVPQSAENVKQLSMGLLNETLQFETKALLQAFRLNQSLQFTGAFLIRDLILSQYSSLDLMSVEQQKVIEMFLQPLYKNDQLEPFQIVCKDRGFQSFGGEQRQPGEYINWDSLYQGYFSIDNTTLVTTIGDKKCNIQIRYCIDHFIHNSLTNRDLMQNSVRSRSILLNQMRIIWESAGRTQLTDILDCDESEVDGTLQFQDKLDSFGCLKQEPQTISPASDKYQLIKYLQFSLYDTNYYCIQEKVSKFTYVSVLTLSQYNRDLGIDHLSYEVLYVNNCISIIIIILVTVYVYRTVVKVALSFEVPIITLSALVAEPHTYHPEDFEQRKRLFDQLNSIDLLNLYDQVLLCVSMYQFYSHSKFLYDQDLGAEYLQALCQIKSFYKSCSNKWMMSICGNNIAQIHYKNKRYNEALNQLAESIMITNQELTSLKQIEKLRKRCELNFLQATLFRRLQSYIINKFAGKSSNIIDQTRYTETQNKIHKGHNVQKTLLHQVSIEEQQKIRSKQSDYRINYKNDKQQLRLCLFFRKYQYIQVLFKCCMNADSKLYNETIENIKLLEEEISQSKQYRNCRYLNLLRIRITIKLYYCYKNLGRNSQANQTYQDLLELYDRYLGLLDMSINYQLGINIFQRISIEQITAQLNAVKIIQLKADNRDYKAALECICLLQSSEAHTKIGQFVFNILSQIVEKHHLDESYLFQLREQMGRIRQQIILLIDYSNEISFEQLKVAQSLCKYILKAAHRYSKIGLYVFNEGLFEIFSVQDTSKNLTLFMQILDQQIIPTGGKSQLFQAMTKSMQISNCDKISNNYICLFSECYFEYSLNKFYNLKQSLELQRFVLVIVQMQNSNKNIHIAQELCNYCDGKLIKSEKELIEWLDELNHTHGFHNKYTEFL